MRRAGLKRLTLAAAFAVVAVLAVVMATAGLVLSIVTLTRGDSSTDELATLQIRVQELKRDVDSARSQSAGLAGQISVLAEWAETQNVDRARSIANIDSTLHAYEDCYYGNAVWLIDAINGLDVDPLNICYFAGLQSRPTPVSPPIG